MGRINFGEINNFILFGGGKFLLYAAEKLLDEKYRVVIFTSKRNMEENIEGKSFSNLFVNILLIISPNETLCSLYSNIFFI